MATVFDVFTEVGMNYLTVDSGAVYGDRVTSSRPIKGIFKTRAGQTQTNNMENLTSTATAHVHPEDFDDWIGLVGNGISYNGTDYSIVGMTVGANFVTGKTEHLTLTLEVADYASNS